MRVDPARIHERQRRAEALDEGGVELEPAEGVELHRVGDDGDAVARHPHRRVAVLRLFDDHDESVGRVDPALLRPLPARDIDDELAGVAVAPRVVLQRLHPVLVQVGDDGHAERPPRP